MALVSVSSSSDTGHLNNKQFIDPEMSSRRTIEGFPAEGKESASLRSLRIWFLSARSRFSYLPKPMPAPLPSTCHTSELPGPSLLRPLLVIPQRLFSHYSLSCSRSCSPPLCCLLAFPFQSAFSLKHNKTLSLNHTMGNFFTAPLAHKQEND